MNEEDLFAAAKMEIFGEEPTHPATKIGRNMAINYFAPIIRQAEAVQIGVSMADGILATTLRNAFTFSDEKVMDYFPSETQQAIAEYTGNFRARYEPLLKKLDFKAA